MMLQVVLASAAAIALTVGAQDVGFEAGFNNYPKEFEAEPLSINGSLPKWLVGGAHLMNGVALWRFPAREMRHNLDGYAKMQAVEFLSTTTAAYTAKFVRSGFYNASIKANDVTAGLLFKETKPPRKLVPGANVMAPSDNININVMRVNGKLHLISDQLGTVNIDHKMNTEQICIDGHLPWSKKYFSDEPKFPGGMAVTMGSAHPLTTGLSADGNAGDVIGIIAATKPVSFMPGKSEYLRLFKVKGETGSWLKREEILTLAMPQAPYMHAFGLVSPEGTKAGPTGDYKYAVLVHQPFYMDLQKEAAKLFSIPMEDIWEFKTEQPVRFYIIDLHGQKLEANITFAGKPFIYSHVLNSYQEGDDIFIDLVGYASSFFDRYSFDVLLNKTARDESTPSVTMRFKVNIKDSTVQQSTLLPGADIELPTVNEFFKGRKNCFAWSWENNFHGSTKGATGFASMAATKWDLCKSAETGTAVRTPFHRPNVYFSETFFVPRPGSTEEDDGVVLTPAFDGNAGHMILFVLDAKTMDLLAEVPFPEGTGGYTTHTRFLFDFETGMNNREGSELVV